MLYNPKRGNWEHATHDKMLHCGFRVGFILLTPILDYDCSPFNLKGYLQKVSRNTGRSRWRNPKRGTKLVRLTVEIRKHRIYRSSVWSTEHFMNLKYELRKHPGSSWLLPLPCPESVQHLQNTVNTNYLLITVNAVAYYKFETENTRFTQMICSTNGCFS